MISYKTWLELSEEKRYEVFKVMFEKLEKSVNENGADIDKLKRRVDKYDSSN